MTGGRDSPGEAKGGGGHLPCVRPQTSHAIVAHIVTTGTFLPKLMRRCSDAFFNIARLFNDALLNLAHLSSDAFFFFFLTIYPKMGGSSRKYGKMGTYVRMQMQGYMPARTQVDTKKGEPRENRFEKI